MARPVSIVRFEQCYWGAIIVGLINSMLNWSHAMNTPQVQQATSMFGSSFFIIALALGIAIDVVLWYFVARRGSAVAKWFVVVFFAFAVLGVLSGLARGTMSLGLGAVLGIVGLILHAIAVWMLFQPDTRAWFGGGGDDRPFA